MCGGGLVRLRGARGPGASDAEGSACLSAGCPRCRRGRASRSRGAAHWSRGATHPCAPGRGRRGSSGSQRRRLRDDTRKQVGRQVEKRGRRRRRRGHKKVAQREASKGGADGGSSCANVGAEASCTSADGCGGSVDAASNGSGRRVQRIAESRRGGRCCGGGGGGSAGGGLGRHSEGAVRLKLKGPRRLGEPLATNGVAEPSAVADAGQVEYLGGEDK